MSVKLALSFKRCAKNNWIHVHKQLQAAEVGESLGQFQSEFPGCWKPQQCPFPKGTKAGAAAEWDSRSSFPRAPCPAQGILLLSLCAYVHPASLDAGRLQLRQLYCLPNAMGRISMDLSCHSGPQLVQSLLSRWHKQALFGNPFLARFLATRGKYCICFLISMWGYFRCCEQSTVLD